MTPGMIRIQVSRMPDGATYFCLARTIHKDSGGYHAQQPVQAIGLGCRIESARELVYSDGVDLDNARMATPVGVTCRLCERIDCEQRAFPSHPPRPAGRRERAGRVPLRSRAGHEGLRTSSSPQPAPGALEELAALG